MSKDTENKDITLSADGSADDTENKDITLSADDSTDKSDETNAANEVAKKEDKKKGKKIKEKKPKEKRKLRTKWEGYKAEYKRIIWPTKGETAKQTVTVIFVSALFGIYIMFLDGFLGRLFYSIVDFFSALQ